MDYCQIRLSAGKETDTMKISLYGEYDSPETSLRMSALTDSDFLTGSFKFFDTNEDLIGSMYCSSLSGLEYTIYEFDKAVADVHFSPSPFTSKPIDFTLVVLGNPPAYAQPYLSQARSLSVFSPFQLVGLECMTNAGFLLNDEKPVSPLWKSVNSSPSKIVTDSGQRRGCALDLESEFEDDKEERAYATRPPVFNSESNCYLHNFGSRIKYAANTNFVLVKQNDGTNDAKEDSKYVVLRCGKISPQSRYVCDYRTCELSTFIAFATACSTFTSKYLVA